MRNIYFVLITLTTFYSLNSFGSKEHTVMQVSLYLWPNDTEQIVSLRKSLVSDSLIISVKTDDKAVLKNIKQYIKSIAGVNGVYYCDNHNVFIVFENLPKDSPTLTDQLKKQYPSYVIEPKSGSVKELMNFCSFNDPADMAGLKAN